MDLFTAMDISASGMAAQRTRMNVISSNLANAQTTRTPEGGPYKRKDVVLQANNFDKMLSSVEVGEISIDDSMGEKIYDPSNPDADQEGYVTMPNVNMMEEMVNMMDAGRAFQANTAAVRAQKEMINQALTIGK